MTASNARRILAAVICAACVTVLLPGTIINGADAEWNDYSRAERNKNIFEIDQTAPRTFSVVKRTSTDVDCASGEQWSDESKCAAFCSFYTQTSIPTDMYCYNLFGFDGIYYDFPAETFDNSKNYVFSIPVKRTKGENVRIGTAIMNDKASAVAYSEEYGSEGALIDNDDYEVFATTITPSKDFKSGSVNRFAIFFPENSASGNGVMFDLSKPDNVYLAEEQAYDLSVQADGRVIAAQGDKLSFSARVLNQLGLCGGLDQEFEWFALNGDRSAVTDKITFSGSGNVTADLSNADCGEYVIVAKAKKYDMVKGIKIAVTDTALSDTDAAKPENLIPDITAGGGSKYLHRNNGRIVWDKYYDVDPDTNGYRLKCAYNGTGGLTFDSPALHMFEGFEINPHKAGAEFDFKAEAGASYVIRLRLKNASADGVTPYFGAAMHDLAHAVVTNEYKEAGMPVGEDWTTFDATITLPEDYNIYGEDGIKQYYNSVFMGMPAGTPEGAAFWVDVSSKDAVYFAKEKATGISLDFIKPDSISAGDEINVKAKVLNQLGNEGTLSQELNWYCVSNDRTTPVEGVSIIPTADGVKIRVNDTDSISGSTRIVAVSQEYGIAAGIAAFPNSVVTKVYVSPQGDDENDASFENPLATLDGAKDFIRKLGNNTAVEVIFAGGVYYFSNGARFTAADSGTKNMHITYRAAQGENVVFSGAARLDLSNARPVTDEDILSRLKPGVKNRVVELELDGVPLENMQTAATFDTLIDGGREYPLLYLGGEEQMQAQWPNGSGNYAKFEYDGAGSAASKSSILYTDNEPSDWSKATDWWIGGYINNDYRYTRFPVSGIDAENKRINLMVNENVSGLYVKDMSEESSTPVSKRWKAFNLLEEIDTPTEWCIDVQNKKLYYYPPHTKQTEALELSVLSEPLISMSNTEYVGFKDIIFENTRSAAINAVDVRGIDVIGCTFKNIGTHGFVNYGTKYAQTDKDYWQRQYIDAAYDCTISDCRFDNIGGHAVLMDGGNVDTLTLGENVVRDNIMYRCAQKISGCEAIMLKGCGNIIEHNNIGCCPFQAIRFYGNDHQIRYNEIHDVLQETDDAGAIYCGRNTVQRGSSISFNYIHDIEGAYSATFGHKPAIYFDDGQTGVSAEKNIIKNAKINVYTNGVDNTFSNNTSVNITKTNLDFRNGGAASNNNTETDAFSGYIFDTALYYSKYPNLQTIVEKSSRTDRSLALLNQVKNNLNVGGIGGDGIGSYTKYVKDPFWIFSAGELNPNVSGNVEADSSDCFVDAQNQDFRVKISSEYASLGVLDESFDINLIGGGTGISDLKPKAVSPYNGENTNSKKIHFSWSEPFGATGYTIEIAADKAFESIITKQNTSYCCADIELPECDGTAYYWRVTAHNTSRRFAADGVSDVYSFVNGGNIVANLKETEDRVFVYLLNNTAADISDTYVFFTEYDEDGRLAAVEMCSGALECGAEKVLGFSYGGRENANVLVWNKEMASLRQPVYLNLTEG